MIYCETSLNFADDDETVAVTIDMLDGRKSAERPNLEATGFELLKHRSAVTDWQDPADVNAHYYDEIETLCREIIGCDAVLFYPAVLRGPEHARKHDDFGPVQIAHADYAESHGPIVRDQDHAYHMNLRSSMERAGVTPDAVTAASRILTLQFWRNIGGPTPDFPMAFCDVRTTDRQDMIVRALPEYGGQRTDTEIMLLKPPARSDQYDWYTFPGMTDSEVVVFRGYDSDRVAAGEPFWALHTSFRDPVAGDHARPRESIEMRAICLFF